MRRGGSRKVLRQEPKNLRTLLTQPARLGREPPPFEQVFQKVSTLGPAAARTLRGRREVHEPPEDAQTEAVQDLVGVVDPAARPLDQHTLRLPDAVAVDGEDLARPFAGGLREAEHAGRVA